MFCEQCGSKLEEDGLFCPECGHKNPAPVSETEPIQQEPVAPAEEPVQQTPAEVFGAPENDGASVAGGAPVPPVRKGITGLALKIVAVVLVVAIVAGAVMSPWVRNTFMKVILPSDKYLQHVVKNNIDEEVGKAVGVLYDYKNLYDDGATSDGTLDIEVGEGLENVLNNLGGEMPEEIEWLKKANLDYKATSKDGRSKIDVDLKVNDTKITSAEVTLDSEDNAAYVKIPEANDKAIGVDFDEMYYMSGLNSQAMMEELLEVIPDEKIVRRIIKRYTECVVNQVDQVTETTETVEVNGVTQKLTKLTVKIDMELIKKVAIAVLEEARDDKDIKKIIEDASASSLLEDAGNVYGAYLEGVDEALSELRNADVSSEEYINLSVYVDSNGSISGTVIEADGTEISFLHVERGSKYAEEFKVKSAGTQVSLNGEGKKSFGKLTGDYRAEFNGIELIEMNIANVDEGKLEKGVFRGKMTIKAADGIGNILAMAGGGDAYALISDLKIVIESKSDSIKKTDYKLSLYNGEDLCIAVSAKDKKSGGKAVKLPSEYVNAGSSGDMQNWVSNSNIEKIMDNLEKAGVPSDLIN